LGISTPLVKVALWEDDRDHQVWEGLQQAVVV